MSDRDQVHHAQTDPSALLRRLAVKAAGFSGADVEHLLREVRGAARRAGRAPTVTDVERALDAIRPRMTPGLRRRIAVHEAGHAVVRHELGIGGIVRIVIATELGGFVEAVEDVGHEETEARLMARLAVRLAGRAAEEVMLGIASSGAGGSRTSDLAQATALAIALETSFGFGRPWPLLHHSADPELLINGLTPRVARRVHRRLERADRQARRIIRRRRPVVERLAARLVEVEALEGEDLQALLDG